MLTFETKVWENDWEYILKNNYIDKMISNCNFNFNKKKIIINNVQNRKEVERHCEIKIKEGIIDEYYCVEDYSTQVLDFFEIDLNSFKGGYVYSISELLGIYLCKTEFLLHFSSDSYLKKDNFNWIEEGIKIMQNNPDIIVANPTWNKKFAEVKSESTTEISNFFLGSGFSDQCYLIKNEVFRKNIYNEKNIMSERYPDYGGELFEKRVDSFMKNNNKFRITHKYDYYISKNFNKKKWFFNNFIIKNRL
jgi:hypothetical protein